MLSLSTVCLVPNRAITASPRRQIMIHVVTTTAGPWSLEVMIPCGGKEPPLPWKFRWSGKCDSDMSVWDFHPVWSSINNCLNFSYTSKIAGELLGRLLRFDPYSRSLQCPSTKHGGEKSSTMWTIWHPGSSNEAQESTPNVEFPRMQEMSLIPYSSGLKTETGYDAALVSLIE